MVTAYSPILKLALPVQGELSGTWGDVVNDNITSMVEQAIAGRAVINTWTTDSHTLTTANGTTSESRCAMLELTDTGTALTGAGTVICPALSKIYIVKNDAGQNITVKTVSGTGILVPDGRTTFLFCDGTNVVEAMTHTTSLQLGTSTVVTAVLDEDDMVSDSATSLATQQSIKAYVDAQVGAFDSLAEVLAVGNTSGANDIIVDNGQKITVDTIDETTAAAGVTIDSVLLKDDGVNATNLEVTNIKANDGTAAGSIADSTGVVTVASAVLTTADINGGTADDVVIGGTTPAAATATTVTANTSLNIAGTVTVTSILDEDNMSSDDPAGLATQQSIKAYVDAQVGTVDTLAEILANGNTTGGTDIVVSVDDVISMDNGTNLLPSLTTTGDLNTGLYFPAADEVGITVGGTQVFKADSTGVDVTGSISADGLTVANTGVVAGDFDGGTAATYIRLQDDTDNFFIGTNNGLGSFLIKNETADALRLTVGNNGDISFYENTGITPKLSWSASNERLGIGTSSPSGTLDVEGTSFIGPSGYQSVFTNSGGNNSAIIYSSTGNMEFRGTSTDYDQLFLKIGGNVGIGTSSPVSPLEIQGGHGDILTVKSSGAGGSEFALYVDGNEISFKADADDDEDDTVMTFDIDGSEAMRIDSSRNLLISGTNTTPNTNSAGTTADNEMALRSDGLALFSAYKSTANDGVVMDINRTSTGGPILGFRKDGSPVGSIGVAGTALLFENPNANSYMAFHADNQSSGIFFQDGTTKNLAPYNVRSGEFDLGNSGGKWKDLYLSNAIRLGDATLQEINGTDPFLSGNAYYNGSTWNYLTSTDATNYYQSDGQHIWRKAASGTAGAAITTWSEVMRIDSSGRVLIGATSTRTVDGYNQHMLLEGAGITKSSFAMVNHTNDANGAYFYLSKARGTTVGGSTIVQDGDVSGAIVFTAADGTDMTSKVAQIQANVDGTPDVDDTPGRLQFYTTAAGASVVTERMRISNDGGFGFNYAASPTGLSPDTGAPLYAFRPAGGANAAQNYLNFGGTNRVGNGLSKMLSFNHGYWGASREVSYVGVETTSSTSGSGYGYGELVFGTGSSGNGDSGSTVAEAMRIDSSGRILIGYTANVGANGHNATLQVVGQGTTDYHGASVNIVGFSNNTNGAYLQFASGRSNTAGTYTIVANGDTIGQMNFMGADGTDMNSSAAKIQVMVDGNPGSNVMPGRLEFHTTADGASQPTERMRIDSAGRVMIAGAAGNVNPPTTLMGDMNAAFRVGTSSAQIGSMFKYTHGPNTNVDGAVFQLRAGGNGNAAYIRIMVSNFQGVFEAHYYCRNASGNWTVNQATVTDVGGVTAPSLTVAGSGGSTPTITVDLNSTSYSGGFLDVTTTNNWQLTLA